MFLQVHTLTSYHATLLNRDEAGLAKRIPFGGVQRLRISSQCLKRHWREWLTENTTLPKGLRTRHFFSREIVPRLIEQGMDPDLANKLVFHLAKGMLSAAGEKDAVDKDTLEMKQPVLFGKPEADFMVQLVKQGEAMGDEKAALKFLDDKLKAGKKNFKALLRQAGFSDPMAGFEGALFGRFVTSDILARVDAPVHVAHAFTTHALDTEVDFFTVVDDLAEDEETGAAHANDMELGAGIFYGYVVVDIPLLISNLLGCDPGKWREQDANGVRSVLSSLVRAIARVTPGAKLGATAPYARAEFAMLETGETQPRSMANAFLQPVVFDGKSHPMHQSVNAIANYLDGLESMYGITGERRYVSSMHAWLREKEKGEKPEALETVIEKSLHSIFGE
ncbi:MAG: type I-E CRISPR-associated protein Cas7/Cse4/CasC [Deltaproteobacteria bacterium]|nr:type I-E CRISPR-associated protein Cas7/Cse4/CasC [Deltaproteobacteria bacterium]